jgi:crotonobetaine/carnitine-CoA ligase
MSINIVGNRDLRKALEQKVRAHPQKTFLIFEDGEERISTYTYKQFDRMVNRTANGLLKLGVKKGDKVNLHLTNCPEFLFFWFAIGKIGAVMFPSNPASPPDELSYPLVHSESVISVTQPDLLPVLQAVRQSSPGVRQVIVVGTEEAPEGTIAYREVIEGQPDELPAFPLDPFDDAAILYTSGTTSRPKGVVVTHANLIYLSETISKEMRMGPEDRHLVTMPLFHGNALYYSFMTTLNVGGSAALMSRFSASRFMRQAIRHGCTVTSLFAAPIRMILAQPRRPEDGRNKLRLVIFAQSITDPQLDGWHERFGAPLMQIYGMTETMGQPLANPLDYTRKNNSMGMVTLGYECRVVDDQGNDLPVGVPGELLVWGKPGWTIMKEYFKDPEATAKTIRDGWLWTGDIAQLDEEGYFRFVDRAKDIIKRSGENVAAGEVEAVIKQHPAVADAAVIGVPDPMRDESIKAFVILNAGDTATEDEVIEFCKARLSKFRVPEFVEFRSEFPRTSVGKTQKHILRQEEAAAGDQQGVPASP